MSRQTCHQSANTHPPSTSSRSMLPRPMANTSSRSHAWAPLGDRARWHDYFVRGITALRPSVHNTRSSLPLRRQHSSSSCPLIFNNWKYTGSLWVHGKRAFLLIFAMRRPLIDPCFYSQFRKKCCLVRPSSTLSALGMTLLFQFLNYTRYNGPARCWESLGYLLLLRFQGHLFQAFRHRAIAWLLYPTILCRIELEEFVTTGIVARR